MDSVNNPIDVQNKAPAFANGFISSLGAAFDANSTTNGLFANLLTQTQDAVPPQPDPSLNNAAAPAPSAQAPQQTAPTNDVPSDTSGMNSDDDSDSPSSPPPLEASATQTSKAPSGPQPTGKVTRHHAKGDAGNHQSNDGVHNHRHAPPASTASTDNSQPAAADGTIPAVAGANNASSPVDQASTDATTDPLTTAAALVPGSAPNLSVTPNLAPIAAATASNVAPVPNAVTPSDPSSSNTGDSANAPASGSVMASQLMLLLLQLERLASSQLASTVLPPTNSDPLAAGTTAQSSNADPAQSAPAQGSTTQEKIDLKALLTAIAGLDDGDAPDASGNTGANTLPNPAPVSSPATTGAQNALSAASTPTPDAAGGKLISADFLNLFTLPSTNPLSSSASLILPSLTGASTGGGDTALDTDTKSDTGPSARNGASDLLLSDTNLLPPPSASGQSVNPYDFASQLSSLRATQGGTTGLPPAIDQVILQLSRGMSKDGSSQMTIQLRPAELGRVDVKLSIGGDGKVQGTVTADNPATLGLLLKDVRGLERALQEAGLRADPGSLQFGLRGDGQPGGGGQLAQGDQSGFTSDTGVPSNSLLAVPVFADPTETYYLTPGGVNMRV